MQSSKQKWHFTCFSKFTKRNTWPFFFIISCERFSNTSTESLEICKFFTAHFYANVQVSQFGPVTFFFTSLLTLLKMVGRKGGRVRGRGKKSKNCIISASTCSQIGTWRHTVCLSLETENGHSGSLLSLQQSLNCRQHWTCCNQSVAQMLQDSTGQNCIRTTVTKVHQHLCSNPLLPLLFLERAHFYYYLAI